MKLQKLLLKKEEIPIQDTGRSWLFVPVHPRLMSDEVHIDKKLASKVLPIALDKFMRLPEVKNDDYSCLKKARSEGSVFFENGLSATLTIATGSGLYFTRDHQFLPRLVRFNKGKMEEYSVNYYDNKNNAGRGFAYYSKDVGMPVLKLYREWAVLYLNEALKQVFKK